MIKIDQTKKAIILMKVDTQKDNNQKEQEWKLTNYRDQDPKGINLKKYDARQIEQSSKIQ